MFRICGSLLLPLILSGCATETLHGDTSGKLTCVGYCELDVENRQSSVKTEKPSGEVVEEVSTATGIRTPREEEEK